MELSVKRTKETGNAEMKHLRCRHFVSSSVLIGYLEIVVLGVFTNANCKTFSFDELRKYVNRARRY